VRIVGKGRRQSIAERQDQNGQEQNSKSRTLMFDLGRIERTGLVARIDYHETIGSTSDRALEIGARDEVELPLLILAERQTAGRGRGANRWWSDEGALTFSLVLEAPPERLPPTRWPQVALAVGVSVCRALQGLAPRAELRVKWPNDVYLVDGKICGILSESIPGWRDRLVVGVGINVNNRRQATGDMGRGVSATSLIENDGVPRDLTDVLVAVLDEVDRRWGELLEGRFEELAADYRHRCLLTGKLLKIEQVGGATVFGLCRGIDEFGRLRVQTEHGETAVVSGTVITWEEH
jgi:BirA family transcriptional regulator, biotin operon repressor / biotin---[acetyl-CoA-carboxylase] ligase